MYVLYRLANFIWIDNFMNIICKAEYKPYKVKLQLLILHIITLIFVL